MSTTTRPKSPRLEATVSRTREAVAPHRGGDAEAGRACSMMLRLALGAPLLEAPDASGWRAVLASAMEERCAPLAWLRSAAVVRAHAPADVVERWRSAALSAAARAATDWSALVRLYSALEADGIAPVVLKGAPLAVHLYGQIGARPSSDIDLFVAPGDRERARATVQRLGWRHVEGEPPWDEMYERFSARGEQLLEVHSTLLHPRLGYLSLATPDVEMRSVEGVAMRAQGGASLAGYLAVHLSTHQFVPMLWWLDLATLWGSMGAAARADAVAAAERCGAGRYLGWALRRVDALHRLASGDASRLHLLGLSGSTRSAGHPMWRHLLLAPTAAARYAAAADWLWPAWMRDTYGASPVGFARRALRHARALLPRRRPLA